MIPVFNLHIGVNEWSTASLKNILNGSYYNGTYTTGALKNDSTRNTIESVVWNLGESSTYNDVTASMFYERERGTTVYDDSPTTWTGKIGLMYPSDYGYATSGGTTTNRVTCMATKLYEWASSDASDCKNNDYLYKNDNQWTLASYLPGGNSAFLVTTEGYVGYGPVTDNDLTVRPAAFLKSNISISQGDGSSTSPYQLKLQ